ncbi:MAG: DUF4389 domain-containing protein [Acidimicrobiia bacterium]|nr:DUF4389 domain-containing protein [Acidimicrobiia bacterium]NNC73950.1 DUF4389 domain-containing protein [Acidimicrobiia bacterium]
MYPVNWTAEYGDGTRSRGFAAAGIIPWIKQLLLLPHLIILMFLGIAVAFGAYVGYWIVAITGRLPAGLSKLIQDTTAWSMRTNAWFFSLADPYPPFVLDGGDNGYPTELSVDEPPEKSRGWALLGIFFLKFLAAIPHMIVIYFLGIAAFLGAWVGFWIVLFTGSMPKGLFDFIVGYHRWTTRLGLWIAGVVDEYPPFSLD